MWLWKIDVILLVLNMEGGATSQGKQVDIPTLGRPNECDFKFQLTDI